MGDKMVKSDVPDISAIPRLFPVSSPRDTVRDLEAGLQDSPSTWVLKNPSDDESSESVGEGGPEGIRTYRYNTKVAIPILPKQAVLPVQQRSRKEPTYCCCINIDALCENMYRALTNPRTRRGRRFRYKGKW